jgi:DNA-binding NtrC family response regulator
MASARTAAANVGKLLDGLATPICLIDENRKVVFCNSACAQWLSVDAEMLLGTQCNYHSSPIASVIDRAAAVICPPPAAFTGKRTSSEIPGPDGQRHAIEFLPLADENGEIVLMLATIDPAPTTNAEGQGDDSRLHSALREFRARQTRNFAIDRLIGNSPQIALARERVRLAIGSSASVLIVGQSGTGRDHIARTIHERGGAPFGPLITLACGTLGAELLVSSVENAVRNHPAHVPSGTPTGTLLLTDIDLLPREASLEFTRLLVPSRTSLRMISTRTQSPINAADERALPAALALALSAIEIHLPPLAERKQDLPLLAQAFLEDVNAVGAKQVSSFLPETLDLMAACSWPGNLDELENAVREAHERAAGPNVSPLDLPRSVVLSVEAAARPRKAEAAIDLVAFLERVERELIERALSRAKGNKSRAAKMLGMTRPKFYRRLVQLKLIQS